MAIAPSGWRAGVHANQGETVARSILVALLLGSVVMPASAQSGGSCGAASSYVSATSVGLVFYGRTSSLDPWSAGGFNAASCARAAFLASGPGLVGVESFEQSADGDPFALSFPDAGMTGWLGGVGNDGGVIATDSYAADATDGDRYYYDDGAFQVHLDGGVTGFGFYTIGQGSFHGTPLQVSFVDGYTGLGSFETMLGGGEDWNVAFLGVLVTNGGMLNQVNFASGGSDYPGYDEFTVLHEAGYIDDVFEARFAALDEGGVSEVTPEPATLTLVGTGIAALVARRRRRR